MTQSFAPASHENHPQDFHQDTRRKFKERMQLSVLSSRRPRKAIAEDMGVCEASLSDWLDVGKRSSKPAHHLAAWTREVGPGLLRWIARENGLGLVTEAGTAGPVEMADPGLLLALISIHHGMLMGQIIQAREDGIIDDRERAEIWPEIQRLIRELEAEAEYFRPVQKQVAA